MSGATPGQPDFLFIKRTVTWRLWALGWHDYRVTHDYRSRRVVCIAFGPLRLHFLDNRPNTLPFTDNAFRIARAKGGPA